MARQATRGIAIFGVLAVLLVGVGTAMVASGPWASDRAFGVAIACTGVIAALGAALAWPANHPPLDPANDVVDGWSRPRLLLGLATAFTLVATIASWLGMLSALGADTTRGAFTWWLLPLSYTPLAFFLLSRFLRGGGRRRLVRDGDRLIHEHATDSHDVPLASVAAVHVDPGPPESLVLTDDAGTPVAVLNPRDFAASTDDLQRWLLHGKVRP